METIKLNKSKSVAGLVVSFILMMLLCGYVVTTSNHDIYSQQLFYSFGRAIACICVTIAILAFAPLPHEVSWPMKIRISLVLLLGTAVIGFCCWPLVAPATEYDAVTLATSDISAISAIILLAVAFVLGVFAFFLAHPFGKDTAVIAVPMGLAIYSIRTGRLSEFIGRFASVEEIQQVYSVMRWEGVYWLLVVAAGIAGVYTASYLTSEKDSDIQPTRDDKSISKIVIVPLLASILIGYFGVLVLTKTPPVIDNSLKTFLSQPENGQIAFSVFIAFGLAGFVCRHFFRASYIYPVAATGIINIAATVMASKHDVLEYMLKRFPSAVLATPLAGILPVQFIAFGSLGAISGYWFSHLYDKWKAENGNS